MRVGLYPRVSGHEQEDNYSIPEQIKRMKAYCQARGWTVYKIYTDSGFSGSNINRPGLQELIKDVERKNVEMVLVFKLDRLSRSQKDTLYLIEDVFDKHGAYFTSITENFDTSTPTGKAFLGILAVFAQFEREQIRERTMIGKNSRAQEGKWHGSKWLPIGYDYEDGALILNEYEAMQIREIADLFLKRTPVRTIANMMTQKGYTHKYGEWDAKAIRRSLSNKVNLGLIKHRDDYYQGTHTPIFDQKTYDDIMIIMNERKEKYGTSYKPHTTLLGGILYCKHCGGKYAKQMNRGGRVYYSCYSRNKSQKRMIKDPNCKNKNYNISELDEVIMSAIAQLSVDPVYIEKLRKQNPINDVNEKVKTISAEIEAIGSQISNLIDLYSFGNLPLEEINKKITALNSKKTALEDELNSLNCETLSSKKNITNEEIKSLASIIRDESITLNDRRNIVQSLIAYIEIDNEDIEIHWKF